MEKVRGEGFCILFQEIKGEANISLLIVALISSANYNLRLIGLLQVANIKIFNL